MEWFAGMLSIFWFGGVYLTTASAGANTVPAQKGAFLSKV